MNVWIDVALMSSLFAIGNILYYALRGWKL